MLLVSRSGLGEENAVEVFHHCGVNLSSTFRENNNVLLLPFPFHIFMPLANLWFIHVQIYFLVIRIRSGPDLYPFIRPLKRLLALVNGESLSRYSIGPLLC
jgi:hypothetical protein